MEKQFLEKPTMLRYVSPKGLGRDHNEHAVANLEFSVLTKNLPHLPVALERWINGNENSDLSQGARSNYEVKAVTLFIAEMEGTEVFLKIPHVTLRNFKLQRDADDKNLFRLAFQAQCQVDRSNVEFIGCRIGTDCCLSVAKTQKDIEWEAEHPDTPPDPTQGDLELGNEDMPPEMSPAASAERLGLTPATAPRPETDMERNDREAIENSNRSNRKKMAKMIASRPPRNPAPRGKKGKR